MLLNNLSCMGNNLSSTSDDSSCMDDDSSTTLSTAKLTTKQTIIEEMQSKIERMESKIQQMVKKLLQCEECLPMLEKMIVDEVLNIDILVTSMFEVVDTLNEQTLTRLSTYIAQYITTHKSFSSLEEQLMNMNLHRQQLMKRILHNIHVVELVDLADELILYIMNKINPRMLLLCSMIDIDNNHLEALGFDRCHSIGLTFHYHRA
ncbi:unnamed protein product [Rotaria sordida]|uniref:Uncharacterized protein n=1 Tax=Rotaria sordida TaxID=392033 RepID=A0A815VT18_9BILA|nr:unnamed protein product [Rotaria sordida]CAF1539675.1 unnamed protein product [Rotaria sordida]